MSGSVSVQRIVWEKDSANAPENFSQPRRFDLLTIPTGSGLMDFVLNLERDEQKFILALTRQERWAQQLLYEQYYGKMMGVCLRYAGSKDEARDLLHEGFIKIFQNIAKYKSGTALPAWMRTIMVNTCIDFYRKNMRRRTDDIDQAYSLSSDDPDILSNLTEQEILVAVQDLSPAYRAVFNLYVVEGYSHKEIGDALGITESTSRSNLVKARLKLQEFFENKRMQFETEIQ
jgi:RNA polymerase sigma factor (sigma-70 family)